ncbi:MAG: flagellin [Agathobacter sp.]
MQMISHNILAMNAQRQFNITSRKTEKSTEKLSSGYKINRAADDAAGLSISEKMRRQIRGLDRGVDNTMEGISLCQVADGALSEVSDMLQRINVLAIQAANGTNSSFERSCIQKEINQIMTEIDRIGETTKFNEIPLFQGREKVIMGTERSQGLTEGDIPFSDFSLADIDLGMQPFTSSSPAGEIALQAIVNNKDSSAYGKTYNLIYGNGSTSYPSIRIQYGQPKFDTNGQATNEIENPQDLGVISLRDLTPGNYQYDAASQTWSRDFNYSASNSLGGKKVDLTITQKIQAVETSEKEKNYVISYDAVNNLGLNMVDLEFMFHADTAYNNNDRCEGYYTNGTPINNNCVYTTADSKLTEGANSPYINQNIPDSFSIVDKDQALAFSEKISFAGGTKPDTLSIGHYYQIYDWPYYDNLEQNLGGSTSREDLGFSLYYRRTLQGGAFASAGSDKTHISFQYGIVATESDNNLKNLPIARDQTYVIRPAVVKSDIWIQSGNEAGDGINLVIGEMSCRALGINKVNLCANGGPENAIRRIGDALESVNKNRSNIGAYQNRLEHVVANESNIVENTTAAESRIRDTDMAEEMVNHSVNNILMQAGQAMMANANHLPEDVLKLLG